MNAMEAQFIEDHLLVEDMQERLAAVAAWGRRVAPINQEERGENCLVKGCVSRVWVTGVMDEDGRMRYQMASDSAMVGGLAGVTVRLFDGLPPAEAVAFDPSWPVALGLDRMISGTRMNGLAAVAAACRQTALRHVD